MNISSLIVNLFQHKDGFEGDLFRRLAKWDPHALENLLNAYFPSLRQGIEKRAVSMIKSKPLENPILEGIDGEITFYKGYNGTGEQNNG